MRIPERWRRLPVVYHIGAYIVLGIILGVFISNFVLCRAVVVGDSMVPTYQDGDTVWVCKLMKPDRGDKVVVLEEDEQKDIIKRVIALPGETIQIIDGSVYINGEYYPEDYINNHDTNYSAGIAEEPITLGEDEYFVMGDNRVVSKDSRVIGPVDIDDFVGVVLG